MHVILNASPVVSSRSMPLRRQQIKINVPGGWGSRRKEKCAFAQQ